MVCFKRFGRDCGHAHEVNERAKIFAGVLRRQESIADGWPAALDCFKYIAHPADEAFESTALDHFGSLVARCRARDHDSSNSRQLHAVFDMVQNV